MSNSLLSYGNTMFVDVKMKCPSPRMQKNSYVCILQLYVYVLIHGTCMYTILYNDVKSVWPGKFVNLSMKSTLNDIENNMYVQKPDQVLKIKL